MSEWKLVPVEPTLEQLRAGFDCLKLFFPDADGHIGQYRVYEAMLAASPSLPVPGVTEEMRKIATAAVKAIRANNPQILSVTPQTVGRLIDDDLVAKIVDVALTAALTLSAQLDCKEVK